MANMGHRRRAKGQRSRSRVGSRHPPLPSRPNLEWAWCRLLMLQSSRSAPMGLGRDLSLPLYLAPSPNEVRHRTRGKRATTFPSAAVQPQMLAVHMFPRNSIRQRVSHMPSIIPDGVGGSNLSPRPAVEPTGDPAIPPIVKLYAQSSPPHSRTPPPTAFSPSRTA
jgi:hypothetical protein